MAPRRHPHPPRDTGDVPSSSTHVASSPIEADDTLDVPSRDLPHPTSPSTQETGTSYPPDDTASVVPAVGQGQQQRRSRGLDPDRIEELEIVDGRYTFFLKLCVIYFVQ